MSTKHHLVWAIQNAMTQHEKAIRSRNRIAGLRRITRHIRIGKKTYEILKKIARENRTTISKTADKLFAETSAFINK